MRVLTIYDDSVDVGHIDEACVAQTCTVDHVTDIEQAAKHLTTHDVDIVMLVPTSVVDLGDQIAALRRAARRYIYVMLIVADVAQSDIMESGANDFIPLEGSADMMGAKINQARQLFQYIAMIGDESEDFPSGGGVIGRSAFNQLFLSGLTRAGRYAEQTSVLFITLDNYDDLYALGGPYVADYLIAAMCKTLAGLRRQSDIAGQVDKHVFALLLQRPTYETEPLEAAGRFAAAFQEFPAGLDAPAIPAKIKISLMEIPSGAEPFEDIVIYPKK